MVGVGVGKGEGTGKKPLREGIKKQVTVVGVTSILQGTLKDRSAPLGCPSREESGFYSHIHSHRHGLRLLLALTPWSCGPSGRVRHH